jgi:hypothetical protein
MPGLDTIEDADKTMFFYSRSKIFLYFLLATILMLSGLLLVSIDQPFPFGIATIGTALYSFITRFIMLRDKEPQLIINEKGIQIRKSPFYTWAVIYGVAFESRRIGKGYEEYLVFQADRRKQEIKIDDLATNKKFLISHIEMCQDRNRRLGAMQTTP